MTGMEPGDAGLPDDECPVIGLLTESLSSLYQSNIWIGASDTAIKNDCSLICFAGGSLNASSWDPFEPQRNIIYNLIDTNRLKGLIIAGSIGNFISDHDFEKFYSRFKNIPMVCLGPEIKSVPSVVCDNVSGMKEIISHLVEHHSCRQIAFIRGPEGNEEAEQRLRIFKDVLLQHGLNPADELIIPGDFSRDAGAKAVGYLLDEYGLHFDAVVGANDDMALGALKAFQDRHVRVPDEVLVVGFDDIEESGFSTPPLTTVRQPLYEIGSRAVELLLAKIDGQEVPSTVVVPATSCIRQSCGCYRLGSTLTALTSVKGHPFSDDLKKKLTDAVLSVFEQARMNAISKVDIQMIHEFTQAFLEEFAGQSFGKFVPVVNTLAWRIASNGGDVPALIRAISILRQFASVNSNSYISPHIEEIIQSANLAIADAAARAQAHRRLDTERQSSLLRSAGQAIASAFDFEQLLDVIANELVKLDIGGCWLTLFENPLSPLGQFNLALSMQDGIKQELEDGHYTFKAPDLSPKGIIPYGKPRSLLVEPLFFRNEQIGFVVFYIAQCRNGLTYEILRQHISSALKGSLLMKKVQEQSLALEVANQQLQKLRDAEHAYLEAIKHELELGREIQATFLPRELPDIPGWEILPAFQPAREVSGDFYDVFTLPSGQVVFVVSDVSGKDVGAALFMSLIRTLIRALAEQALSGAAHPLDAVFLTNKYLINHHYGNNGRYMYATLFMAVLNLDDNTLTYVNAGHNPPAVFTADGQVKRWIDTTGPAVGIIPEGQFSQNTVQLDAGEMLFIYTDGVTEARNSAGALFTKKRLAEILSRPFSSANEAIESVETVIKDYCEGKPPHDDITMLAVRRKPI
jgi:serine phosphatase RsbU (regulator of sigma subunit)/DNA-binding LacI/PurR family transcriptional regulator